MERPVVFQNDLFFLLDLVKEKRFPERAKQKVLGEEHELVVVLGWYAGLSDPDKAF